MKPALLKPIRVASIFVTLWLTSLQVHGSSQAHELILPSLLPVSTDSLIRSQQLVPRTNQQSNTTALYDLVQELHTLPVGKEYRYYLQILEQQGYLVLDTYNDHRHWEFTLEKMGQNLRLTIGFNPTTKTSTMITASGPRIVEQY
jgi:hypothetical protein